MATEIERKYLVKGDFMEGVILIYSIRQGYLCNNQEKSVRIRISDRTGYITIKGSQRGITRFEWEKEIELEEAEELLALCSGSIIEKTRFIVPNGDYKIEVDQFHGENRGLIIAEIELNSESDVPPLPIWIGEEVTYDKRYHNSYLSQNPYKKW
jgi:adenylate cyclase